MENNETLLFCVCEIQSERMDKLRNPAPPFRDERSLGAFQLKLLKTYLKTNKQVFHFYFRMQHWINGKIS